ncbi:MULTISPECIES: NAD(P)/FAD-dependent oxidoreductase [Paenibacillus]|uniref:NAD(P)/FAD-dependent oxidoreductase n=1 Tax=Paenibacillus TaxID=44249 RepID=UPI0022B876B2|nr:NAD(P)/FAD-dependent oxidoreductase [Paenibacillus caseinilyticus]MCZ8521817.1 NAD(P)/FAD-dependent oxidoreductase [Paenibacillus caseinilyticus]
MVYDCAVIGGGPAGLNAALVLGRARRSVALLDDNRPRNAVSRETHGFLTRDGIRPSEFRRLAREELAGYPSVAMAAGRVVHVRRFPQALELALDNGSWLQAKTLILAAGFKETLPDIPGVHDFYGRSLFNCPYCDGWELRDKALVLVSDGPQLTYMAKLLYNWSRDLLLCTQGGAGVAPADRQALEAKGLRIETRRISRFSGTDGALERVEFEDGTWVRRDGGFVRTRWTQAVPFGAELGCRMNGQGGILADAFGRTSVPGVYAAGDAAAAGPSQLIIAAAAGSRAAMGVNLQLTEEAFR